MIALVASGCSGAASDGQRPAIGAGRTTTFDKAGNPIEDDPITLTLGWYGGAGRPQAQVAERFAEEVAAASDGDITINIQYGQADPWQQFATGASDMLLTPTRSLDTIGVHTFNALSVPFLVSDDEQADRVADSPVVETMMKGLSTINATGLVFAPVYEMHLATAGDAPLRSLDQLRTGLRVAPPGTITDRIYSLLGATPTHDLQDAEWQRAVDAGDVLASEFPVSLATAMPEGFQMSANFAVFYEFVVIAMSDSTLGRLSPSQVDILRQAASTATRRSIDERVREDDSFRNACTAGATLTAAPMPFIADVGRAVDDEIVSLLSDRDTKQIYDRIATAAGAREERWPSVCSAGATTRYTPPDPPSPTFPRGSYRIRGRTREQLLVSGVSNDQATNNESEYIDFRLGDPDFNYEIHRPQGSDISGDARCTSNVTIDPVGHLVVPVDGCGWDGTYTWSTTSDGIALELLPTDDLTALTGDWDNSAIGLSALIKVT